VGASFANAGFTRASGAAAARASNSRRVMSIVYPVLAVTYSRL
jgi:hypothetical protein